MALEFHPFIQSLLIPENQNVPTVTITIPWPPRPPNTTSPLTSSSPKSLVSPQTVGEGSFLDGVMGRLVPLSQPQPQLHSWLPLIREPWKRRGAGWGWRGKMLSSLLSRVSIPPSLLPLSLLWCPPLREESPPLECGGEGELWTAVAVTF